MGSEAKTLKSMNQFYETMAAFLEELRCDSDERDYVIAPDDMKNAEKELAKRGREYAEYLSRMPVEERVFLEKYMDVLNHAHFKEEQRAYYQGMMDAVQLLGGLNLLKTGNNMGKLIEKLQA